MTSEETNAMLGKTGIMEYARSPEKTASEQLSLLEKQVILQGLEYLKLWLSEVEQLPSAILLPDASTRTFIYALTPVLRAVYEARAMPMPLRTFFATQRANYRDGTTGMLLFEKAVKEELCGRALDGFAAVQQQSQQMITKKLDLIETALAQMVEEGPFAVAQREQLLRHREYWQEQKANLPLLLQEAHAWDRAQRERMQMILAYVPTGPLLVFDDYLAGGTTLRQIAFQRKKLCPEREIQAFILYSALSDVQQDQLEQEVGMNIVHGTSINELPAQDFPTFQTLQGPGTALADAENPEHLRRNLQAKQFHTGMVKPTMPAALAEPAAVRNMAAIQAIRQEMQRLGEQVARER